jgi:prepilin-type N-terminal cleavage/methylation domain-containing protein
MATSARSRRGFSLAELVVAVIIIGVLATLAFMAFRAITDRADLKKQETRSQALLKEAKALYVQKVYQDPSYTFQQALTDAVADLPPYNTNSTALTDGHFALGGTPVFQGSNSWILTVDTGPSVYSGAPNDIVMKVQNDTLYIASATTASPTSKGVFGLVSRTGAVQTWIAECSASTCDVDSALSGPPSSGGYGNGTTTPIAPLAPTISSITPANAQLTVAFQAPASAGTSAITNYEYSTDNGTTWVTPSPAVTATPVVITGLTNGTTYQVMIRAVNASGSGQSSTATSATPSTAPGAPTGVTGTSGQSTQVPVSWTAPVSTGGAAITSYTATASPGGATCTSAGTSCTVTGLSNGTSYTFTVRATNAAGTSSASSASAAATPSTAPGAPTGVTGTSGQSAQVPVSWTAPVSTGGAAITSYTATASPGGATCTSAATSCTVTGLTNGTSYTFTVTATNTAGTSAASSASASATPYTTPSAPSITSTQSGTLSSGIAYIYFNAPASSGGSAVTNYQYSTNGGSSWTTRSPASTSSPITLSGLTDGTTYSLAVRAVNAAGSGTASSNSSQLVYTVPAVPTVSVAAGDRVAYVTWSSNGNGGSAITSAYVQYSTNGGSTWATYGSVATSGSQTIYITGLERQQITYTFRVALGNSAGYGNYGAGSDLMEWSSYLGYQEILYEGWALQSHSLAYSVILQGDRNLVEYGPSGVRWAFVKGCSGYGTSSFLGMQGDTNLVLYCSGGAYGTLVGWASSQEGRYGYSLYLQDDGYVCLRSGWYGDGSNLSCW